MVITAADGTRYTGVAVLERNRVIVLFAVGEPGARAADAQATAPQYDDRRRDDRRRGGAMSLWDHEHRQRLQEDDEDDGWRR